MGLDVFVHDDKVTLDLSGLDRLWCLAGHLEVPTAHITGARVVPVDDVRAGLGWRVGGGYWPGLLAAGWFTVEGRRGARQFWCVYRDPEVVVVDTDLDQPARLVFQHPDRDRLAWLIGERVGGRV
jgi:hypothetical protein